MKRILLLCFVFLGLAACGKKTADNERTRYQAARDRIEAIATKNPSMKADIQAKLAEFDKAYKAAEAKSGDEQIAALSAVTDRMNGYEQAIAPAPTAAKPDASSASKLGSTLAPDAGGKAAPASQPASQPAGKLGTAPASQPVGKLGAAPASAPADKLGPASAPAKSGFGGGPPDAGSRSGFGGK